MPYQYPEYARFVTPRSSPNPLAPGASMRTMDTSTPGAPHDRLGDIQSAGLILQMFGALTGAVGSFYAAKSQSYQMKSQAKNLEYQQTMSNINARMAEEEAQSIMQAGEREIGQYTMRAGQAKASQQVVQAASGIQAGVGSAAETMASMEYVKQVDSLTINSNRVRAASAARMQAANYRAQGLMQGVSAQNLYRSARNNQPWMGITGSLMGSAGTVAANWAQSERISQYYNR